MAARRAAPFVAGVRRTWYRRGMANGAVAQAPRPAARLLFVLGASPQVVTETVWCLLHELRGTVDVVIVTTTVGRDAIAARLLGRQGGWQRLRAAYPEARRFRLARRNVVVLTDARGRPLPDLRTRADNAAAAEQLAALVARLTAEGEPPLHASIAGGRKTMGHLLAAAMTVYGRAEDRLSHVLVWPAALEGSDFFFPPPCADGMVVCRTAAGREVRTPAREIRVELAELPFVRVRGLLQLEPGARPFVSLVAQLQRELAALARPELVIDETTATVQCGGRTVPLSPVRFAIYALLAARRAACAVPACAGCAMCTLAAAEISEGFRTAVRERVRRLGGWGVGQRWGHASFRAEVSKLNAALARSLGRAACAYRVIASGPRGARRYGVTVSPSAITIRVPP